MAIYHSNPTLLDLLKQRLANGLQHRSVSSPSKWAETFRIMGGEHPGPWTFIRHPWTKEIHDTKEEYVVCQKGAQLGITETALNKTFATIDLEGKSVLYLLPASKPDASDFSASRFDPALEMCPRLREIFTETMNIGHKRAGAASLFIRGSRSRSQLKSLPVAKIMFDELDEMVQENIPLALERTSGHEEKQFVFLSTPTIPDYGINDYFRNSTQDHYHFKCPSCSRFIELQYPDNLVVCGEHMDDPDVFRSHLICNYCKSTLDHKSKVDLYKTALWVPSHTDKIYKGYYINQLYSTTIRPHDLVISLLRSQFSPSDAQEFWNSKLGLPFIVDGARVLDSDLDACIGNFVQIAQAKAGSFVTMGVDVGNVLHYEISEWFQDSDFKNSADPNLRVYPRVLKVGRVNNFEDLDVFMNRYKIRFAVVDAQPEKRKSLEFCQRWRGRARMCYYTEGISSRDITTSENNEYAVNVDRTSWLDISLQRFGRQKIRLPQDVGLEYREHVKAPVRVYKKDKTGNPVGRYVNGSKADHLAHARNYSEIALRLAAGGGVPTSLSEI